MAPRGNHMQDFQKTLYELKIQKMKILQDFPFDQVAENFKHLRHSYSDGSYPDSTMLLNTGSELLDSAIQYYIERNAPSRVSTGRLVASVHVWESCIELELAYAPFDLFRPVYSN